MDTLKITRKDMGIDILNYDFIFAGSGVTPAARETGGGPFQKPYSEICPEWRDRSRLTEKTFRESRDLLHLRGTHTGINEAIPAVKYMGQLFDHLGYAIVGEWYIIGEYHPEKMRQYSVSGRLGDIRERPCEQDLQDIEERVKGVLKI